MLRNSQQQFQNEDNANYRSNESFGLKHKNWENRYPKTLSSITSPCGLKRKHSWAKTQQLLQTTTHKRNRENMHDRNQESLCDIMSNRNNQKEFSSIKYSEYLQFKGRFIATAKCAESKNMKKMNVNKVETEKNNTTKQKIKFLSLASKDKRSEEEPKQQLIMKKNVYSYSCSPAPSRSELPVSEFTSSQPPSQTLPPSEPSEPPASQLLTPEKASTRHFIDSLPGNTVFFCCACWHYVFTIQKTRHYPNCIDKPSIQGISPSDFMNLVYKKLQLIIKLSKYTNTRYAELQKLHTALINNELLPLRDIISGVKFFTLDQIEKAYIYVYNQLPQGFKLRQTCNQNPIQIDNDD